MPLVSGNDLNLTMKAGTTISSGELTDWVDQVTGTRTLTVPTGFQGFDTTLESLNGQAVASARDEVADALHIDDVNYDKKAGGDTTVNVYHYVIKSALGVSWNYIEDGHGGNQQSIRFQSDGGVTLRVGGDSAGSSLDIVPADEWGVLTVKLIGIDGSSADVEFWWNDTKIETATLSRNIGSSDGIVLGARGDLDETVQTGENSDWDLAQVVHYMNQNLSDAEIEDNVEHLQTEWSLVDDTAPTYTTDGTLSVGATDTSSIEITYDEAQDETTAQADIVYRLYRAPQGTALDTLSEIDSNGSEVASGTGVASLTDTTIDAGTTYEYNVTAEDEAQNRLAYNQIQVIADNLVGNVTLDGSPVQGAHVAVHTLDDFDMTNFTFLEIIQTDSNGDYQLNNYDDTKHHFISVLYLNEDYTGTAESGTSTTLEDTDQAWGSTEFDDGQSFIEITGGTGSGQIRRITSNTADTVTVEHSWDTIPDATSTYRIGVAYSDESRFIQSKD